MVRLSAPPLPQQAGDLVEGGVDVGVDGAALLDAAAQEQVQADVAAHAATQAEVGSMSVTSSWTSSWGTNTPMVRSGRRATAMS